MVFLILNDRAKTKLTILVLLYCGEIEVPSPGQIFIRGGGYSWPIQIQSGGGVFWTPHSSNTWMGALKEFCTKNSGSLSFSCIADSLSHTVSVETNDSVLIHYWHGCLFEIPSESVQWSGTLLTLSQHTGASEELFKSIPLWRQLVQMAIRWQGPNGSSCILRSMCAQLCCSPTEMGFRILSYRVLRKFGHILLSTLVLMNMGRSVWFQSCYEIDLQLFLLDCWWWGRVDPSRNGGQIWNSSFPTLPHCVFDTKWWRISKTGDTTSGEKVRHEQMITMILRYSWAAPFTEGGWQVAKNQHRRRN